MAKNAFYMLDSHNTLKTFSVHNRKEETAINSLREIILCYLYLPRELSVNQKCLREEAWNCLHVLLCM